MISDLKKQTKKQQLNGPFTWKWKFCYQHDWLISV